MGSTLPSIPELIVPGERSDSTIKRALQELREAGMIETRRGAGTYVIRTEPARTLEERVASLEAWRERLERGDA